MWLFLREQNIIVWALIIALAVVTSIRVILDTRSPTKTAAYLLLIVLLPIGGPIFYLLVGINYRKRRIYSKKLISNEALFQQVRTRILSNTLTLQQQYTELLNPYGDLIELLIGESLTPLSSNKITLLINGEEKYPALYESLEKARQYIHMEYFIFEDDVVGNKVKDILIKKAKEGVAVRVIFDDFGSHELWDNIVDELRENGVQIHPFYRIMFPIFANRLNYRDHRKVVIIDGKTGFIGGINISHRYLNDDPEKMYWRDTHIKIEGGAVLTLQYHFLSNWNFCSGEKLGYEQKFFPVDEEIEKGDDLVQIVTSGPDYPRPSCMLAYFTAIMMAQKSVYITSPYFIPNESIFNAIRKAALSGRDVRLLLPGISDTKLVNAASRFYFHELLQCGVKIYLYQKGFNHAKSMTIDDSVSFIGTTNMDLRSFELNFEIDAVIYSKSFNKKLTTVFLEDLNDSEIVTMEKWNQRNIVKVFIDALARIFAPLL